MKPGKELVNMHRGKGTSEQGNGRHTVYSALRALQAELRRKQVSDPELSQSSLFKFCAPLFIFFCIFVTAVIVPRRPGLKSQMANFFDGEAHRIAITALFLLTTATCALLLLFRGVIWIFAKFANAFCEMDFTDSGQVTVTDPTGNALTLSQTDIIVGGVLG